MKSRSYVSVAASAVLVAIVVGWATAGAEQSEDARERLLAERTASGAAIRAVRDAPSAGAEGPAAVRQDMWSARDGSRSRLVTFFADGSALERRVDATSGRYVVRRRSSSGPWRRIGSGTARGSADLDELALVLGLVVDGEAQVHQQPDQDGQRVYRVSADDVASDATREWTVASGTEGLELREFQTGCANVGAPNCQRLRYHSYEVVDELPPELPAP